MNLFFALCLLFVPQAPVETVRVEILTPEQFTEADAPLQIEFARAVGVELRKLRERKHKPLSVVIASQRVDFRIRLAVAPLTESCRGYVGGMSVKGANDLDYWNVCTADSLPSLARQVVETLDRDFFSKRKE